MTFYITAKTKTDNEVELELEDDTCGTVNLSAVGKDGAYYTLMYFDEDGVHLSEFLSVESGLPVDKHGKLKFS